MSRWNLAAAPVLIALALSEWLVPSAAVAAAIPASRADAAFARALDAYVKPLVDRGDLSGQLLVAHGDRIVLERSYGFANRELSVPVTPESRFNVASITKPMTSIVAVDMIYRHAIGYHDSIARWLPGFPHGDSIRIEHLLQHSSGIRHELLPDSLATRPRTAAEMVAIAATVPLDFPPGSRSSYSSGGFTVLARILEIATGMDYGTLLEERIFRPLGMTHSRNASSIELLPDRTNCYVPGIHGVENAPLQDFSRLVGAGSVWTTARDLHKLVQAVVGGRLGPAPRTALVRRGKLEFSGRTSGFRAYADWDSASGLEVIFAGNQMSGAAELIRFAVPRLWAGGSLAAPSLPSLRTDSVSVSELGRMVGDFKLGNGILLALRVRDGALWANEWLLLPTTDGAFFSPRDYGLVRGVAGTDGRIERIDWTQNGEVYPAPRVAAAR